LPSQAIGKELGSGKTTIANAVLGFVPAAAGTNTFDGEDIAGATRDRRRRLSAWVACHRWRELATLPARQLA
jgi:ABC-type branched-subunit amino acid transport system ATPase component